MVERYKVDEKIGSLIIDTQDSDAVLGFRVLNKTDEIATRLNDYEKRLKYYTDIFSDLNNICKDYNLKLEKIHGMIEEYIEHREIK